MPVIPFTSISEKRRRPLKPELCIFSMFVFLLVAVIFVRTSPQDTPQGNNDRKFQRQIETVVSVYLFAIIHFSLSYAYIRSFVERETYVDTKVKCI